MQGVVGNVIACDSSARTSIQNFEGGNGDVAITYENEVKTAHAAGSPDEAVYPKGSILIENPVAVVDKNADGALRDRRRERLRRLPSHEGGEGRTTRRPATSGRPTPKQAAAGDPANGFPAIKDLFTVDDLGGWDALDQKLFSDDGIATQAKANAG